MIILDNNVIKNPLSIRGQDACEVNCASIFGPFCLYDTVLGIVPTPPNICKLALSAPICPTVRHVQCTYNSVKRTKDPSMSAHFSGTQLLCGALQMHISTQRSVINNQIANYSSNN